MSRSAGSSSLQSRQTRRNTQMVTSDEGTHVMDPWKDDRLRDFIAINVQTRLLSFHLPLGAPLADAGDHNRQRVDQLLLLPRTAAMCHGGASDCVLRRIFCRIYGPAALHHERHEQAALPAAVAEVSSTIDTATPLRHVQRDIGGESPDPLAVAAMQDAGGPSVARNLLGAADVLDAAASAGTAPAVAPSDPSFPRVSTSITTAGSATPIDYHADLDCRCCAACVDAMCAHFQSMLLRGIIFDRFSQKDLLFAHWVLFRHMEGPPLDAHTSVGRREALSIQIKSGYYDLLKVPRAEETATSVVASPALSASDHHHHGFIAEQRGPKSKTPATAQPRKRGRDSNADEPDPLKPPDDEDAATSARQNLRETCIRDVETKTYATRRSAASSSARADADPNAAVVAAIKGPRATAAIEKKLRKEGRAEATERMPPPANPVSRGKRKGSDVGAGTTTSLHPVKHEAPGPPPASSVLSTPTSTTSPMAFDTAATDVVSIHKSKAATKQAAARMKDEEGALRALLGLSKTDDPVASLRAEMYQTTSLSTKSEPYAASNVRATASDERIIVRCATTAMASSPLQQYTFEQQCLLLLAAARCMAPDVSVGATCPAVPAHRRQAPMNYWAANGAE